MSQWKDAKVEQPNVSGDYLVAEKLKLSTGKILYLKYVWNYSAEYKGWNVSALGREHELFPDYWMPLPEDPIEEEEVSTNG